MVLLFVGKNLPAIDGVKTLNASKAKMIIDHFVKPDGSNYNEHSLGTMQESVKRYKKNEETEEIIKLLKEIMEMTIKKNKK